MKGSALRWPLSVMVHTSMGWGVEAEEVDETAPHTGFGITLALLLADERVRALTVVMRFNHRNTRLLHGR